MSLAHYYGLWENLLHFVYIGEQGQVCEVRARLPEGCRADARRACAGACHAHPGGQCWKQRHCCFVQ
eukprot:2964052-Prorocentrum_lima.AAC.1